VAEVAPDRLGKETVVSDRPREEAEIAAWLLANKPKKLRKGRANAPPISKIRQALKKGKTIVVRRSGGRDISYGPQPGPQPQQRADSARQARSQRRKIRRRLIAQKTKA
jgi:hypothetical protein